MKKTFLLVFSLVLALGFTNDLQTYAATIHVMPETPRVSSSVRPCIAKYKQGNYTGAMQDLEALLKKEKKNTLAKYYLALCYTRLGYKSEAKVLYSEVAVDESNEILTHYSKRALECLDNPESERCKTPKTTANKKEAEKEEAELDDITRFIRSGNRIHPAAMDRITRERMERKLQESEYIQRQKELNASDLNNLKSDASAPTNEEIASALNTLSKIGINPFENQTAMYNETFNTPINQIDPMMLMNNGNMYNSMMQHNNNPEYTKIMLMQTLGQQNNIMNYGI